MEQLFHNSETFALSPVNGGNTRDHQGHGQQHFPRPVAKG
jgi:hypothetical protein